MTKKLLILLLDLFSYRAAFAQQYERLVPFTDYSQCGHGLKTTGGKIILESVYDQVDLLRIRDDKTSEYWLVVQAEKAGVINEKGEWVFPLEYDRISACLYNKYFLCTKDSTTTVFGAELKPLFTADGISEIMETDAGFVVKKGNKTGFMNFRFEWVIPCLYEYVYPMYLEYWIDCTKAKNRYTREGYDLCDDSFFQNFFEIRNEHGLGVMNDKAEVIIPCNYDGIEMVSASKYFPENPRFFRTFQYNGNRSALLTIEGKEINPNTMDSLIRICRSVDTTGTNYHCFALYRNKQKNHEYYKVVNMLTLQQSEYYDDISVLYDHILVKKGAVWNVLSNQLEVVWSGKQPFAHWRRMNRKNYEALSRQEEGRYPLYEDRPEELPFGSNCFWTQQTVSETDNLYATGIVNYQYNREIPPVYEKIVHYELNGERFFWAHGFKTPKTEVKWPKQIRGKLEKIDVYNDRFELLNTIDQRHFLVAEKPVFNSEKNRALYFAADDTKSVKIYSLSGKLVFSDTFEAANQYWNGNTFTLKKELWGLYDFDGKLLLPHVYDGISNYGNFILATKNELSTLFDASLKLIMDSIVPTKQEGFEARPWCSNFSFKAPTSYYVRYLRKDNKMFILTVDTLLPVNDHTINMKDDYLVLLPDLIVNRKGEIIPDQQISVPMYQNHCPYTIKTLPGNTPQVTAAQLTGWQRQYNSSKRTSYWYYYNNEGKKVSETGFDRSFAIQKINAAIVNGMYSFVDENLKQIGTEYYKHITSFKNGWLTFSSQGLRWHDKQLNKSTVYFTKACAKNPPGRMIVFKEDYLGILNDSLQFEFPLKNTALINHKDDLAAALGINLKNDETFAPFYHLIKHPDPELTRFINNLQIIWHAREFALTSIDFEDWDNLKKMRPVKFVNSNYVSFAKSTNDPNEKDARYGSKDLENYAIENYTIRTLNINDLIPKANWGQLDELLLAEINKGQYFGQNCVNVQERLNWLKQHFLLTETGISFYYLVDKPDDGYFFVSLSYARLNDILAPEVAKKLADPHSVSK